MIKPRTPVPQLQAKTLKGMDSQLIKSSTWTLYDQKPRNFTMLVFYRGYHCPLCRKSLKEFHGLHKQFQERGIETLAISADNHDRAEKTIQMHDLEGLTIGYDFSITQAQQWGLYVSTSRGKTSLGIEEPDLFFEPGLFLITPQQELYGAIIQTMPFARPNFNELLNNLDFIIEKNYPARGEY